MYKLLIVDDNYYDRIGISELDDWNRLNFSEIHLAEDGEEGLKKALETEPLLVLTDVSMPGLDGLTMAREILSKLPNTKFIFMSCFEDSAYIRDAISVNAFAYILKPVKIEELMKTVKKILKINEIEIKRDNTIKDLTAMVRGQMPLLREKTLRDLVYGEMPEQSHLAFLGMELKSCYTVTLLKIESAPDISKESDNVSVYLTMNKINSYFLSASERRVYSFMPDNNSIVVLSFHDASTNGEQAMEDAIEYFEEIKLRITEELGASVYICVGGVSADLRDISSLYTKARRMLELRLCQRPNMVIVSDEGGNMDTYLDYDLKAMKAELTEILVSRDRYRCERLVNKYYHDTDMVDEKIIKEFTLSIICTVQLILYEMNMNMADIFGGDYLIWEKLSRFSSIYDIKNWIYNILLGIIECLNDKDDDPKVRLANQLRKIIEEQYLELDNVSQVADQVYVSTVHANSIFKKNFDCTMFDYLTKLKVEKAKELLKKTDMKVYEIADHIGYKSKTYFTSLFKDYTGMTPKEYRHKG
ncbi:MAG: response regulator [Clostridia bacterium]|nr:response regulator [Clostridia bacterium]